jgi:hypothetical protein
MKRIAIRLWNNDRFFAGAVTGVVAALVTAGVIAPWATVVAVAAFLPVNEVRK